MGLDAEGGSTIRCTIPPLVCLPHSLSARESVRALDAKPKLKSQPPPLGWWWHVRVSRCPQGMGHISNIHLPAM